MKVKINYSDYWVDDLGNVYDESNNIVTPTKNADGYDVVYVRIDGKKKLKYVHRLVAEHFVDRPSEGRNLCVHHIDCDKHNNRADNLEWSNRTKLLQDCHESGLYKPHMLSMHKGNQCKVKLFDPAAFKEIEFDSIKQAALYIQSIMGDEITNNTPAVVMNIEHALNDHVKAYGFYFERI